MAIATLTDPTSIEETYTDELVQLRRWATTKDPIELPELADPRRRVEYEIGTDPNCDIRVVDPDQLVSKHHARLVHDQDGWKIYDRDSKNGLYVDRQRCAWAPVRAGTEVGLGQRFIFMAESARTMALRGFLQRLLGWGDDRASTIDLALRSILAVKPGRAFAVVSKSDPVAIAYSIHRLAVGTKHPFITSDPKRKITNETVRYTENYNEGAAALVRAAGGTLCVVASRLPRDYDKIWAALIEPTAVARLAVCATEPIDGKKFLTAPIFVPPLSERSRDLKRIIHDYAVDAVAELGGRREDHLLDQDLEYVRLHDAGSLAAIETATLRLVALRKFPNMNQAAARLGMTRTSLIAWIKRRGISIDSER
ncbi:MAG: FHA domain-containing protein [Kofleriaceae bacterium]